MLPVFSSAVSAGFPSPADDYLERHLDLNEHLIEKPAATFFVRANGDSMINAGIFEGDLLIIDRSCEVKNGSIVLAVINGEFTIKRLIKHKDKIFLKAENIKYKTIEIKEEQDFFVWGVALHVIHNLK